MQRQVHLLDGDFLQQIESCSLDPTLFNHVAHVRYTWLILQKHGLEKAISLIQVQLKNYVTSLNCADKFNVTLTVAAIKIVHHFMQKSTTSSFDDLVEEYPKLVHDFKSLIDAHYSADIYNLDRAKHHFLSPDKIPFS